MQIDLSGRSALVTGGSSGLGRAIALRLAASGARVAILARDGERVAAAAAEAADRGPGARGFSCDITDAGALDATMDEVLASFERIDILVNNAGSSFRRPVEDLSREAMIADLDLKLFAGVRLVQRVLPGMRAGRWGRIINVTAIVGKTPDAGSAPTSFSRAAGITLTKSLSCELAPDNILVNALCVGKIKSGQWERRHAAQAGGQSYEDFLRPTAELIPLKRLGEAEEFANVACFLASDAASYVTGCAINVDGGLCAVT
jgi:3-oxoacyl-[acyl-carrier protein] reductase